MPEHPTGDVVAIHQPNYIPWAGYFHKLASCDVFVLLDSVQYPRGQSITARNLVKTANGVTYLTIPVRLRDAEEGKASYLAVEFADSRWKKKHLRTVQHAYGRAPYFDEVYELYARELEPDRQFVELTVGLIDAIARYLGIDTPRIRLSELLADHGQKTDLILEVCRAVGASTYLSGTFARVYNDEEMLASHGISVRYDEFECPVYPQLWGEFVPNLSVLDLLFNCGPGSAEVVLEGAAEGQRTSTGA
jgi:hypothetical protein